jgi:putative phosphoesterase
MLLGVISDIHSNLPALEAVLAALERLRPGRIICAGDIVGYNASPDDVCGLLKEWKVESIMGNHDRAVATGDTSRLVEDAASAVTWTRKHLSGASRDFIEKLFARRKLSAGGLRILLVHGSPEDDDEYVLPLTEKIWPFGNPGADVLVMGHTHVQWTDRFRSSGLTVLNPGSVGQPRDNDPRAAFATLDTRNLSVRLHRVDYDIPKAARAVIAAGLPARFAERLYIGR